MTGLEMTGAAVGGLAVLVAIGMALAGRAINAPDKGRHAAPRDNADEADALAWFAAARVRKIPPQMHALIHVASLRAALAGAAVPVPAEPAAQTWQPSLDDTAVELRAIRLPAPVSAVLGGRTPAQYIDDLFGDTL